VRQIVLIKTPSEESGYAEFSKFGDIPRMVSWSSHALGRQHRQVGFSNEIPVRRSMVWGGMLFPALRQRQAEKRFREARVQIVSDIR